MIIIPHTKKLLNGLQKYLQVTKRKSGWTNLGMIEATKDKSKSNSFQEWIFGQAKWACLSYWNL